MNPLQTADIPGTCTPLFVGDFITVISTAPFVVRAYNWIWLNTYHLCKQITAYTAARASVFGQGQVIEWTVGWCKYPHQYVEMAPIQRQANHLLQRVGGIQWAIDPCESHTTPTWVVWRGACDNSLKGLWECFWFRGWLNERIQLFNLLLLWFWAYWPNFMWKTPAWGVLREYAQRYSH